MCGRASRATLLGERMGVGSGLCARCAVLLAALPILSTQSPSYPHSGHGRRKRAHSSPVFRLRPWKALCDPRERMHPTGHILHFAWHTHQTFQVSDVPIDAQNALILELSAGILPNFRVSVREKSKIPHFSRNRSASLMGTGQTVPLFHIAERTQNLTRRQENFPNFPLKPRRPPTVLLSYCPICPVVLSTTHIANRRRLFHHR